MRETGVALDPSIYLPAVRGYYSLPDGRMMSMPFNSSTAITFYNKDAFRKAGLDPAKPPGTWPELVQAARKIKATNAAPCAFGFAWPTWTQVEQFSAIHDVPLATRANGMGGLDAELRINSPLHVRHLQTLIDMHKEGTFKYGGRDAAGDALFPSGECAILHGSSGLRGRIVREAKFEWGAAMLPYYPEAPGAPKNSIIGGASFWVMTAPTRRPEEYKAVAEFFRHLSQPEVIGKWHTDTGFLPITFAAFERVKASGYYQKNPGADVPFLQLTRSSPTENSRGLRLGNMPEIRNIIQEEIEKALQGQQSAQQALDNAVQRGNVVLRTFERTNR
jgi:sn-glycerol 3-phosphate transport system substrate-binding protein